MPACLTCSLREDLWMKTLKPLVTAPFPRPSVGQRLSMRSSMQIGAALLALLACAGEPPACPPDGCNCPGVALTRRIILMHCISARSRVRNLFGSPCFRHLHCGLPASSALSICFPPPVRRRHPCRPAVPCTQARFRPRCVAPGPPQEGSGSRSGCT